MSENFAYDIFRMGTIGKSTVLYEFHLTLNRKTLRDGKDKPSTKHLSVTNPVLLYMVLLLKTNV